jgi:hypothetical protein
VSTVDVSPVIGFGVRSDRWKKFYSSSVVVLLPPGTLIRPYNLELLSLVVN